MQSALEKHVGKTNKSWTTYMFSYLEIQDSVAQLLMQVQVELSKQIWTQTRAVFDLHVMYMELKVEYAILIKYTFYEIQQVAPQSSSC